MARESLAKLSFPQRNLSGNSLTRTALCLSLAMLFVLWLVSCVSSGAEGSEPAPLTHARQLQSLMTRVCQTEPLVEVTPDFCSMPVAIVRFRHSDGQDVEIPVLVAASTRQRAAGYQHISPAVISRTAILFVYSHDTWGPFHMCNVAAPLDVAWFASDGSILDLQVMEPGPAQSPGRCPAIYSPRTRTPYRFALEAPHGYFQAIGLEPGSQLVRQRP